MKMICEATVARLVGRGPGTADWHGVAGPLPVLGARPECGRTNATGRQDQRGLSPQLRTTLLRTKPRHTTAIKRTR